MYPRPRLSHVLAGFEDHIDCKACAGTYIIDKRPEGFVFVAKEDEKAAKALEAKANEAHKAFRKSKPYLTFRQHVIGAFEKEPTVAAKYRLAKSLGLADHTEGTFRSRWSGADRFLSSSYFILTKYVASTAEALGYNDSDLEGELKRLHAIEKEAVPAKAIGKPFFRPSR